MRSKPTFRLTSAANRLQAGFTLAEVLAALAFLAIVIPVAVQGLRVASLAGQVGQRTVGQGAGQNGVVQEGLQPYRWTMRAQPWPEDAMLLVTVQVTYLVQGQEYDVHLSTLMNSLSP